jgi:hypothetical protein
VERGAVVFAGGAEGEEVLRRSASGTIAERLADLCRLGHGFAEDFDFDVAGVGVKLSDQPGLDGE